MSGFRLFQSCNGSFNRLRETPVYLLPAAADKRLACLKVVLDVTHKQKEKWKYFNHEVRLHLLELCE